MTTITREQAQKIIDAADEVITALAGTNEDIHPDNYTKMCEAWNFLNDNAAPPEVVRELARVALASLEAEPYGYVHKAAYEEVGSCGLSNDHEAYRDSSTHIAVYTAPPAPVVPEEMTMADAIMEIDAKDADRWTGRMGFQKGWNACRAAMLQSFGNSEQIIKHQSSNQDSDSNAFGDEIKHQSSNCIPGVQAFIDAMIQDEDVSLTDEGEIPRFRCNSTVIPDGWVIVPVEPTMEMLDEFDSIIDYGAADSKDAWRRLIAAAPQLEVK